MPSLGCTRMARVLGSMVSPSRHGEHDVRRLPELDGDLGSPPWQALARAQIERHVLPAPVVDHEADGAVGRRRAVGRHVRLLPVAGDRLAVDRARAVLAAHRVVVHHGGRDRPDGAEHLDLLVAHGVGAEGDRRLHGHQREELQQVVLEHVAHHARFLVVPAPMLHAHALRRGDLHVVHVLAVPHRLEDRIGEPEDQEVLDRLLAQVVIDPVHLVLGEGAADAGVQRAGALQARGRTASR